MAGTPHIYSGRLVAFLSDQEALTPEEHEHVLGCDNRKL